MNRVSLRMRITLLTGIIVLITSFLLTAISVYNAKDKFTQPLIAVPYVSMGEYSNNTETSFDSSIYYADEVSNLNLAVRNAQKQFTIWSYIYMLIVMIISMVATYIISGKALKPVSELSDEIKNTSENNLSKRIQVPLTGDEIESLTQSFNGMLERLEQAFERQKRFSSNAAHELKTPLATIKAGAQVLKMDEHSSLEEYRENLELTLQSTERLIQVVNGLLLLGGNEVVNLSEQINLEQLLETIQTELSLIISSKNITVKTELAVKELIGNSLLLYSAFFNLIENALKYTNPNGRITITSLYNDGEIIIRIADTGIGIDAKDLENIFEPFYRAEKSRSRKIAGAGLGLSITKEIIDRHHAFINITSQKGKGTTVEVRFKAV